MVQAVGGLYDRESESDHYTESIQCIKEATGNNDSVAIISGAKTTGRNLFYIGRYFYTCILLYAGYERYMFLPGRLGGITGRGSRQEIVK